MFGRIATLWTLWRKGKKDELRAAWSRGLAPAWLFRRNELVVVRVTATRPLPRPLDNITFRWATPADESAFQSIRPRRRGYGENFARGCWAVIGFVDNKPGAFGFFEVGAEHRSNSNGYRFRLGPEDAWAFGIEVAPKFRLSGIFPKYWNWSMAELANRGKKRVFGSVQADNPLSINSHRRLGFDVIYRLQVRRTLGLTWHAAMPQDDLQLPESRGWGRWCGGA